jgi:hypothetical protein
METHQDIKNTVRTYVESYLQADAAGLGRAFHADTRLLSIDQGKLEATEMRDWLTNVDERKKKGDIRVGTPEILSIDHTGDAAVAKLSLKLATVQFTDYLSLLRIDGAWKIVGKIYTVQKTG